MNFSVVGDINEKTCWGVCVAGASLKSTNSTVILNLPSDLARLAKRGYPMATFSPELTALARRH